MRLTSLCHLRLVLLAVLIPLGTYVTPAAAAGNNPYGPKVDDALAELASSSDPDAELHVIVFRKDGSADRPKLKPKNDLELIGALGGTVSVEDLAELAHGRGVDYIVLDNPAVPTAAGTPVSYPNLATIHPTVDGAQTAWSLGYTGAGVGVAVVDSGTVVAPDFGLRLTQPLLSGQLSSTDTYGHGAFVTSIVGGSSADGRFVGIAPGASLYGVDVVGTAGTLYSSDVIAGLNWVAANATAKGIRVVNLSLSETVSSSYLNSALDSAVEQLWRAGIVVVTSAGNLGPASMLYAPANDPFAITVGASDSMGTAATADDIVASFSSSGLTNDNFAKPDLLAPGRRITALLPVGTTLGLQAPLANIVAPGYAWMSGTSFSAPQVAGAAAILLQQHPTWTPDQVKAVLMQTTRPLAGTPGALDIAAAVRYTAAPASANVGIAPAPAQASTMSSTVTLSTSSWNTSGWNTSGWNSYSWD
jgi:serine protease AprX